jgi:hypothetical protein
MSKIRQYEIEEGLAHHKRLFIHPERVSHDGLVKRPSSVPELEQLGPTKTASGRTILTDLLDNPLDVPASGMNKHFKAWRKALEGWQAAGPIEFRRLARGTDDAFDFLTEDGIAVEVLGPLETQVGNVSGLAFLAEHKGVSRSPALTSSLVPPSASHTINALKFGNVQMLFAGDLNNAAEEALLAEHAAGRIDLESEVLKVPHHGAHEFAPGFLTAVSPMVSVVSSGDETSRTEFIHPRATLMNALGRHARGDLSFVFVTEMVALLRWPSGSPQPPSRSPARSRHDRSSGSGEPPSG